LCRWDSFAEKDIQIYLGLPTHPLNGLLRFSGQTTSRKIVDAVFPWHRDKSLSIGERLRFAEGLPDNLKHWLAVVSRMITKIREEAWEAPPISVLNFQAPKSEPWICRAEHLCGQVPDGAHRVLAYTVLADEFPERPVRVRVLGIHPFALAIVNSLTIALSFLIDPLGTPLLSKRDSEAPPISVRQMGRKAAWRSPDRSLKRRDLNRRDRWPGRLTFRRFSVHNSFSGV
jgi:hypothetical protein